MDIFVVIMAGGVGSRFWPRSKEKTPKQLLKIFGDETLIQQTVNRVKGLAPEKNIFVITNKVQKEKVIEQLPQIPAENIIAEPFGKNTAPCIGLSAVLIKERSKDAVIITLPADHYIQDVKEFQKTINTATEFAFKSGGLVTIGINPTKPETGYGYIQVDDNVEGEEIYRVTTFAEKPNFSTAKRFLSSGDFMWNSGMFIWRADVILNEIDKYLLDLSDGLKELEKNIGKQNFEKSLTKVYGQLKSISIDYGVMEKSPNVFLVKGSFAWSDVGSWDAVYELSEKDDDGNALVGDVYAGGSHNSFIYSKKKFAAAVGVDNIIVIDTEDALLICNRSNAQDVKDLVDYLKLHNRTDLL